MAGMGIGFARKNRSTDEYFVGGRRFPGRAIGLSMVGTAISSITFLSLPADSFKTYWLRFLPYLFMPVSAGIAAIFFIPFFPSFYLSMSIVSGSFLNRLELFQQPDNPFQIPP